MQAHVTVGVACIGQQRPPSRVLFCAVDGPVRVLIEADNEDLRDVLPKTYNALEKNLLV